ncbi:MAG TPA: glycosyltransferase family 2 protein [Gemmatimonadales bacterium]|nr:glycosyltransferase family 2 protein [Gemmatimonadales bacterium]
MIGLSLLVACVAVVLLVPTVSDLLSVVRIALSAGPRPLARRAHPPPRLLFIVPAHNEELLIGTCLRSFKHLRYPADCFSIVVIADNCSDRTVELVEQTGVQCLRRNDRAQPGKPRAIAWALAQLPLIDYAAVVIVDADTTVDPDFAMHLALAGPLEDKAVQAFHGVRNPAETSLTRMGAVLAAATHRFAYPLKQRAGLNVPLGGNGMAIGTHVLTRFGWRAFSICEDWEMYAQLTEEGVPIEGVPAAIVYGQEARSLRQSSSQRQRWTAGKVTVLMRLGPRILTSGRIGIHQKLDALGELAALGPVLHFALVLLVAGLALAGGLSHARLLTLALGASLLRPITYGAAGLAVQPEPWSAVASFTFLPVYAAWRLGTAMRALRLVGDKPWVRTQRHPPQST